VSRWAGPADDDAPDEPGEPPGDEGEEHQGEEQGPGELRGVVVVLGGVEAGEGRAA